MARKPIRPLIIVNTNPQVAKKNSTIQVSCRLYDPKTQALMRVARIFMSITSMNDGHQVWPWEVVRKDSYGFDIEIGTMEMKEGHRYLLRISNNWNMSPSASAMFEIEKPASLLPLLVIPLMVSPLFVKKYSGLGISNIDELVDHLKAQKKTQYQIQRIVNQIIKQIQPTETIRIPVDTTRLVAAKKWVTQLDHRVCERCRENSIGGKNQDGVYDYKDDTAPKIPEHPRCFTEGTEVLTNHGFKDFKDVDDADLIFSLNPETHIPEYVPFVKKIGYHYQGKIHRYSNKWNCVEVTPNHMMYAGKRPDIKNRKDVKFRLIPSEELDGELIFYKSSEYRQDDPPFIQIGRHRLTPEQYAILMGYYLSEGNTNRRRKNAWQIKISQEKKESREIMYKNLLKLPFEIHSQTGGFYIYDPDLGQYLHQFGKSWEKYIPTQLKNLSKPTLRIFLDCFLLGDGNTKSSSYRGFTTTQNAYHTSSHQMASDLVEILIKTGKSASMTPPKEEKLVKFKNGTYLCTHLTYLVQELSSQYIHPQKEECDYDGMVRCLELEKNHVMLVKKDNKVSWQGNCRCTYELIFREPPDNYQRIAQLHSIMEILPSIRAIKPIKNLS